MRLTAEQKQAARASATRVAVSAGAGTGKTTLLVGRVKWLVEDQLVDPSKILVVTFTRRACNELRERIDAPVDIETFHSAALTGHPHEVYVLDEPEFRAVLDTARIDSKELPEIQSQRLAEAAGEHTRNLKVDILRSYLSSQGKIDFLGLMASMMLQSQDPLSKLRGYEHVLVDEAQDTDEYQFQILNNLEANLFCVGDFRQSIYGWRGATGDQFMQDAEVFHLTEGFRNPLDVTALANHVASTFCDLEPVASQTWACGAEIVPDLFPFLSDQLKLYAPEDIAILTRTNRCQRKMVEYLEGQGIPTSEQQSSEVLKLLRFYLNPMSLASLPETTIQPKWAEKRCRTSLEAWKLTHEDTVSSVLGKFIFKECEKEKEWWNNQYGDCRVLDAVNDYALSKSDLQPTPGVTVCTTHQAKGLEWPVCFAIAEKPYQLTVEERQVWYVALTRASDRLFVTEFYGEVPLSKIIKEELHARTDAKH